MQNSLVTLNSTLQPQYVELAYSQWKRGVFMSITSSILDWLGSR
jgi:hypothetical protein